MFYLERKSEVFEDEGVKRYPVELLWEEIVTGTGFGCRWRSARAARAVVSVDGWKGRSMTSEDEPADGDGRTNAGTGSEVIGPRKVGLDHFNAYADARDAETEASQGYQDFLGSQDYIDSGGNTVLYKTN